MLSFQDFARHPALAGLGDRLASMTALNEAERLALIEAAAASAGISHLDVEMAQPGASSAVPFASAPSMGGGHHDDVAAHVHRMIGARR